MKNRKMFDHRVFNKAIMPLLIGLSLFMSSQWITVQAQQKIQIAGQVMDGRGEAIIGASVLEKGTTIGTITDMDGNFSLSVSSGAILQISYIGYVSQDVKAISGRKLSVILKEDTKALDEVVVVGYGVQKKSDVTGSVTSVAKERLENLPVTNVLQAVQGSAAGITITQSFSIPGAEPTALVRGQNSINANTSPYIVVDGIPISKSGGSLNDINPNDIASMEILKDASAVAIYGTNGANGVILITTKRGQVGKPTIKYSGYVGVDEIAHVLKPANAEEYLKRYRTFYEQKGWDITSPVPNAAELENYNAGITTDWIDDVSQTGIIQNHNLSISGGTESTKYYISGDYMNQKGVLKGFQYKRFGLRANIDSEVTNYLKIGTNIYVSMHNQDGGRVNLLMASAMSPYAQKYDTDGSYKIYPMAPEQLFVSPYLDYLKDAERRKTNLNLNGYAEVNFGKIYAPLAGLTYKLNVGYNFLPARNSNYSGAISNDLNGTGNIENSETTAYTIENILTYSKDFGKHHLDLTALYSAQEKEYLKSNAKATGFVNDLLSFNNLGAGATASATSEASRYAACSQMGRLNYSYDSRYLFTFTVRRDGSSVFGANTSKYGTFPSVALGWNISREKFMEKVSWLNSLKLRTSYGKSGNEAINVYQTISTSKANRIAAAGVSTIGMAADVLGNADLTWETTKGFNLGVDFGLLNNRIVGTIDLYKSNTTDLLLKRNLPRITGYDNVYANMGETSNKGIEVTLTTRNIVTKKFSWESTFTYSKNENKIVDLYGDKKDDVGNRWFIGQPIGVVYDYVLEGVWQEDEIAAGKHLTVDPNAKAGDLKFADLDGSKTINADGDKTILGQTAPKWIGGMINTFKYGDWNLSIFIQTVQGAMKNNPDLSYADEAGRRNIPAEVGYWTAENRNNARPSLAYVNSYGYGYPTKASYTRIKDVTLSYVFKAKMLSKLHLGGLTVYASGRNLYTFTNWIGWDPEARMYQRGHGDSLGNDGSNYPNVRSLVFGLNLTL